MPGQSKITSTRIDPADHVAELHRRCGQDRRERVAQNVLKKDAARREALAACGPDVQPVLLPNDRRAREARADRKQINHDGGGGKR